MHIHYCIYKTVHLCSNYDQNLEVHTLGLFHKSDFHKIYLVPFQKELTNLIHLLQK